MKTANSITLFGIAAGLGTTLLTGAVQAQDTDYERTGSGTTARAASQRLAVGTPVKVKLLQDLSSDAAHVGDRVRVQVASDDGHGLPASMTFVGRVRGVRPATAKAPGVIDIRFDNGANYDSTSFVPDEGSAHLVGQKPTADNSKYMTYGAGGGALIGLLRKGQIGDAVEGAALGALGGYAANQATKKAAKDVSFKSGDEITMRLDRPLSLRTEINAY